MARRAEARHEVLPRRRADVGRGEASGVRRAARCSSSSRSTRHGKDTGASFVAIDHVQAGVGDKVIVLTEGNGVRQILKMGDIVPIRSMIVGIVDHVETA